MTDPAKSIPARVVGNRYQLLTGKYGQYFHDTVEDRDLPLADVLTILNKRDEDTSCIQAALQSLQKEIYDTACEKGWWPDRRSDRNMGEAIALMHSELSEGLEALRHGRPVSDHIPPFELLEEELADVIVRVLDFAGGFNLSVVNALLAKIQFNHTRPYKHGGKEF